MIKKILLYLFIIISVILIAGTLLSLLQSTPNWYIKVLDFPRPQFLILSVICLLVFACLKQDWQFPSIALVLGLVSVLVIQSIYIMPYTFLGKKTVPSAELKESTEIRSMGILIANVLMTSRKAKVFLEIVRATAPEMILVMETDQWWVDQLQPLRRDYPYTMIHPQSNTYGMALYSKLPLRESKVMFLSNPDVPSFHTQVQLPSGESFMFHGVHPVPPVPSRKHPDNVGEKELALVKVGSMVAANALPDIVAGDYNDISWSYTTRLFQSKASLNNVRLGRGLYNSFNARSPIRRWPLDHFFVTEEFALLKLDRLHDFNSDHFPMYAKLILKGQK